MKSGLGTVIGGHLMRPTVGRRSTRAQSAVSDAVGSLARMSLASMLFGSRCAVCSRPGPSPCIACSDLFVGAGPVEAPEGLDDVVALLSYEGAAREFVTSLKYSNHRDGLARIAVALGSLVDRDDIDLITWAPTSRFHRRERGYDQAELLAKALARSARLDCASVLERLAGPAQTGRGRAERLHGVEFRLREHQLQRPVDLRGARVAVVDDVMTTGATLEAAATVLRRGGAETITGVVLAVTPLGTGGVRHSIATSRSSGCRTKQ